MKIIGIIGSRRRNSESDYKELLKAFLEVYEDGDELVSGGCWAGGDAFCERIAKEKQIPIKIYYAQWDKLGKGAGFARNTYIARDSDILIALVSGDRTGGAEDTIKKAEKMKKKIILLTDNKNNDKVSNVKDNEDWLKI